MCFASKCPETVGGHHLQDDENLEDANFRSLHLICVNGPRYLIALDSADRLKGYRLEGVLTVGDYMSVHKRSHALLMRFAGAPFMKRPSFCITELHSVPQRAI